MTNTIRILALILLLPQVAIASANKHLAKCWDKMVNPIGKSYIQINFQESKHHLGHLSTPWETYHSADSGWVYCNGDKFMKVDSMSQGGIVYFSKTQFSYWDSVLLYLGYGDKTFAKITSEMILDEPLDESRYTPVPLLSYFYRHTADVVETNTKDFAIYELVINSKIVDLHIGKNDDVLQKVTVFFHDDLYGDVTNTTYYSRFKEIDQVVYPSVIYASGMNDSARDTIKVASPAVGNNVKDLLDKPTDYNLVEKKKIGPEISVQKYSDNIHFITLKHTNGRSMVVEFSNYLLVAEVPLSPDNGELIIAEAKRIAPGKPIKYFIFCHHHPDYIGGLRAFVYEGANILCTADDIPYVKYLVDAPHTLQPDSLEIRARHLQTEEVGEHKILSDGKFQMEIYHIGAKSEHTKDYLIYYFPTEKMLFEGDLVAIPDNGPVRKAGKRQAGLYHAIKDLNLDVMTIEQSWPVADYGVKSEIPFSDMEASMKL
jgi:glyoxylase-like metal-dependent hydrolase (beta-lactamase superfamily II)